MARREFEESFAGLGRKIDNALNACAETFRRFRNRLATGGLFERFERSGEASHTREKIAERVADAKERLEGGESGAKVALVAFGAGAALVVVVVLVLVFGLGMFRGTGLTTADLERDAQLRQAAERAQAEREATLNPAAMVGQQHRDGTDTDGEARPQGDRGGG